VPNVCVYVHIVLVSVCKGVYVCTYVHCSCMVVRVIECVCMSLFVHVCMRVCVIYSCM
jgi:hypothetical protein